MSKDNPDFPKLPPPERGSGPSKEPRGGNLGLGILVGALALYVVYVGSVIGANGPYTARPGLAGPSAFIPIAGYLAIAILLAVWPPTSRWGAGLLIGLGIFTLLGGGICVMALSQMSSRI